MQLNDLHGKHQVNLSVFIHKCANKIAEQGLSSKSIRILKNANFYTENT